MFRTTTLAILISTALSAQCHPTITQATTLNRGLFCSTVTYTFTVCNPAGCVQPLHRFTVDFSWSGADNLDQGSRTDAPNWSGLVNVVGNKVEWTADGRFADIQPGNCATFSISTNCNPTKIEGIQNADFFAWGGTSMGSGVRTGFVVSSGTRSFLGGSADAPVGQIYFVSATSALDPLGQNLLLASPWQTPTGLQLPEFGTLFLDPILIIPVAMIPLDPQGVGGLPLPIPPSTELIGGQLSLQALTLSPQAPRLSNALTVTFR